MEITKNGETNWRLVEAFRIKPIISDEYTALTTPLLVNNTNNKFKTRMVLIAPQQSANKDTALFRIAVDLNILTAKNPKEIIKISFKQVTESVLPVEL